jgi:hypothetical protein
VHHLRQTICPQGKCVKSAEQVTVSVAPANYRIEIVAGLAPLAAFAVGIEESIDTQRAEIVHILHHGNTARMQGVVDRGRNQRVNVMNVSNVRPPRPNEFAKIVARSPRPHGVADKANCCGRSERFYFIVVPRIKKDFVPLPLEHGAFFEHDGILSSELLKEAVN